MRAVITVIGQDKIGIIAEVSRVLAEHKINVLDITQTIMQDMFTMIMLVNLEKSEVNFKEISKKLEDLGEAMSLSIRIQHEDLFRSMHRI
ncbi:MAG: ACT domain-containing protein [Ruminococcaceae bacterium]|nr:ACT domain-containing protein [Oscillospiraceae bacterium]